MLFLPANLESLQHLLYECTYVKNIWLSVFAVWNKITGKHYFPSLKTVLFGSFGDSEADLNVLLMFVKRYIMSCKFREKPLNHKALFTEIKRSLFIREHMTKAPSDTLLSEVVKAKT